MTRFASLLAAASLLVSTAARADEGMWTFDKFPIAAVNAKYGTNIDQAWLDRLRLASVRIQGCSASFVSPEGLILTNWHCVVGCAQELSDAQHDYVKNGWMTANREEEKKCEGQTAEVLTEGTHVTDRVPPGVVYTTFHFPESGVNLVTTENSDWATNCPEYKVTAVQLTLSNQPSDWQKEWEEREEENKKIAEKPLVAAE